MTKLSFLFVASLAVIGCKKKDDDGGAGGTAVAAGGGGDCASVINAAVDRLSPQLEKEMTQMAKDKVVQMEGLMKSTFIARCTADKWPAEHLKCLAAGQTNEDMKACEKSLPEDLRMKLKADMKTAMAPLMGEMMHAAGSGSGS